MSRRWIATLVSAEETSTQVRVLFEGALAAEGLTEHITPERVEAFAADATRPILLAASDNGPQTASRATRGVLRRPRRRPTPRPPRRAHRPGLDREPLRPPQRRMAPPRSHHRPAVLDAELARVRRDYNQIRLHAGIGYVTPDDEHHGRGDAIRRARTDGLARARRARIDYHRTNHNHEPHNPPQVG